MRSQYKPYVQKQSPPLYTPLDANVRHTYSSHTIHTQTHQDERRIRQSPHTSLPNPRNLETREALIMQALFHVLLTYLSVIHGDNVLYHVKIWLNIRQYKTNGYKIYLIIQDNHQVHHQSLINIHNTECTINYNSCNVTLNDKEVGVERVRVG